MLTLVATLTDQATVTLKHPLSLTVDRDYRLPCDEMVIEFAGELPLSEIAECSLYDGTTRLFYGLCDRQTVAMDARGGTLALECRSPEAALLDNEALPRAYYYPSLGALVREQASRYGVKGVTGGDPRLSRYTVFKGVSVWKMLDGFCRQAIGRSPRLTEDGVLDITPRTMGRELVFGSQKADGCRYISVTQEINRCEVISEVRTQTPSGSYGASVKNPAAGGVQRLRLINPSGEWSNLPKQSAQDMIRAAMLEKTRTTICAEGVITCDLGDTVQLCDTPFSATALFVGGIRRELDARGLTTTLTLYDRQYI